MENNIFNKKITLSEEACQNILNCNTIESKDLKNADGKLFTGEELLENDWLTKGIPKYRLWIEKKWAYIKTKIILLRRK